MNKWFKKILGVKDSDAAGAITPSIPIAQRPKSARRSKRADFPSKSMRRGVQIARELAQRPFRLAGIRSSQEQGVITRALFRKKQLVKREIRAELRKAA